LDNTAHIEDRLAAIEGRLTELCKRLVSENVVPTREPIAAIASQVAAGDLSSLRAHNKARQNARRFQ
jgi:hypothetical protein